MPRQISIRVAAVVGMTAAEAVAATVWLTAIHATSAPGDGGVYAGAALGAGAVLAAGLAVEGAVESWLCGHPVGLRTAAFAVAETVCWTQWAIIATAGLWSRTGIGPATVVLAVLLAVLHGLEGATRGESWQVRHWITGLVEAVAVSAAWVALLRVGPALAALTLAALLAVEHGSRHEGLER
jgi:hypothetical protein